MRSAIREVAADAIETVSYFDMPRYSYEGYHYNGMFAWFGFKKPFLRLHVRPEALMNHNTELENTPEQKPSLVSPQRKIFQSHW